MAKISALADGICEGSTVFDVSVTVVSADGMLADGLSTSCYVMGLEQSVEYWRNYGADFDLILMDENGEVYVTEPLSGQFTSDYKVHVISQEGIS